MGSPHLETTTAHDPQVNQVLHDPHFLQLFPASQRTVVDVQPLQVLVPLPEQVNVAQPFQRAVCHHERLQAREQQPNVGEALGSGEGVLGKVEALHVAVLGHFFDVDRVELVHAQVELVQTANGR